MIHRWRARSAAEAANRAIASRLNTDRLDLSLAVMFSKSLSKDPLLQMEEDDDDARVSVSYFILGTILCLSMIAILRCAVILFACISAGFGLDRGRGGVEHSAHSPRPWPRAPLRFLASVNHFPEFSEEGHLSRTRGREKNSCTFSHKILGHDGKKTGGDTARVVVRNGTQSHNKLLKRWPRN